MSFLSDYYPQQGNLDIQNIVLKTGNQTISGVKNFISRPTYNGSGLAITGEFITVANLDTQNIVLRTGDQLISGIKTFSSRPTFNGTGLATTGDFLTGAFLTLESLENANLNISGLVGVTTGQLFVSGFVEIVTGAFIKRDDFLWTGSVNNLNQVKNKFPGQIVYVTGDKNLYFYKSGAATEWEKIVTNDLDDIKTYQGNFQITNADNGQIIYVNNSITTTGTLAHFTVPNTIRDGFNVSIVQMGNGVIEFPDGLNYAIRNRYTARRTAGQYAIASIIKLPGVNEFLLYGDVI
jgi:hypothetical protein